MLKMTEEALLEHTDEVALANQDCLVDMAHAKQEITKKYEGVELPDCSIGDDSDDTSIRKTVASVKEADTDSSHIYKCTVCSESFSRLTRLRAHMRNHKSDKDLTCDLCSDVFSNTKDLTKHRRTIHDKAFTCKLCHTTFFHYASYKQHQKAHSGEKPHVCHECGASFVQSGHLNIHKRIHTGEKPYKCDICLLAFKQISHLKTHVRTHTQDRPFRCDQCDASFTQNSSLTRHRRSHNGEKPYKCTYCSMTFVVKSNMQRHLFTHTGVKPYTCSVCPAAFIQAIDLKRHKISHSGIRPYRCNQCEASFSRKNNLKWHELTHVEGAPYSCDVCAVRFASAGDLKLHKRVHAPPKPFKCSICPASFVQNSSLVRHKMIHTGERPLRKKPDKRELSVKHYVCTICNASFCERRNFKRHLFSVHKYEHDKAELALQLHSSSKCNHANIVKQESDGAQLAPSSASVVHTEQNLVAAFPTTEESVQKLQTYVNPVVADNTSVLVTNQPVPLPQIYISIAPGEAPVPAKPANNCPNHHAHVLTYVDGSSNLWHSWCFCDAISPDNNLLASVNQSHISEGVIIPLSTAGGIATTVPVDIHLNVSLSS